MFQLRTRVTTSITERQHEIWGGNLHDISFFLKKSLFQYFWFRVLAHQLIRKMFCSALYCDISTVHEMQGENKWRICSEREDQLENCAYLTIEPGFGCFNVARFEIINLACFGSHFIPRNRFVAALSGRFYARLFSNVWM